MPLVQHLTKERTCTHIIRHHDGEEGLVVGIKGNIERSGLKQHQDSMKYLQIKECNLRKHLLKGFDAAYYRSNTEWNTLINYNIINYQYNMIHQP